MTAAAFIDILDETDLLLPSPVDEGLLRMVAVTPVLRLDEVHFVLRSADGGEPIVHKDHEAAIALQVITSFHELCEGRDISKIFFYAAYDGGWKRMVFADFNGEKPQKAWPECDSGAALSGLTVTSVKKSEIHPASLKDDVSAPAFAYWWHTLDFASKIYEANEEEIDDDMRTRHKAIPVGDVVIEETQFIGARFLFAVDSAVLEQKIEAARTREGDAFISVTRLFPVSTTGVGSGCYYFWVAKSERSHRVTEPGEHKLEEPVWNSYRQKIKLAGGLITPISDSLVEVHLATEIDMSQPHGGELVILKRGKYRFEISPMTDDEDLIPF